MKRRIHFNALFLAAVWAKCTFEIFLSYLRQQCGACSSCSSPSPSSPSSPPSPPSSFPFASPPQIPLSSRFSEFCFHSPHSPPSLDAFLLFLLFSCSPPPALLLPPAGRSWSGGWRQFRKRKTQTFFPWRDLVLNSAFSLSLSTKETALHAQRYHIIFHPLHHCFPETGKILLQKSPNKLSFTLWTFSVFSQE